MAQDTGAGKNGEVQRYDKRIMKGSENPPFASLCMTDDILVCQDRGIDKEVSKGIG